MMRKNAIVTKLVIFFCYSIPIVILFLFIFNFGVNLPRGDDWSLVDFFHNIQSDNVKFNIKLSLFLQPHNEHIMFFPRLIFLMIASISKWNIKVELWFSFLLSIINFLLIYKISKKIYNLSYQKSVIFYFSNLISSFILFSLVQYENWLWGFQIAWFLIISCMISAIYFIIVPVTLSLRLRLIISVIFCFVASFSSAHGLLTWLCLIPVIIVFQKEYFKIKIVLIYISLFLFCAVPYIMIYQKKSYDSELLVKIKYFFALIGSPIFNHPDKAIIIGIFICFIFVLFNILCLYCIFKINIYSKYIFSVIPFLSIGWFAILFAVITTLGRAGLLAPGWSGVELALSSRYTSISNLLLISCMQISFSLLYISYNNSFNFRKIYLILLRYLFIFIIGLFIFLFYNQTINSITKSYQLKVEGERSKICLELINYFDIVNSKPDECFRLILMNLMNEEKLISLSNTLSQLNFRKFPDNVQFIEINSPNNGYIENPITNDTPLIYNKNNNTFLHFSGWAIFPHKIEQPKAVLFSYGANKLFFATTSVHYSRLDVSQHLNSKRYINSGWAVNLSLNSLPIGDNIIKAWVYDQQAKQFVRLGGEPKIRIVE